ncbi:dicarboxylate/amino acid:cation symporter [Xylophilus sp.]|uniref:dicarboxylate/amino acid:cation symporter n=1 Tax=Xylophilus sp. TaxID=2653893 RepID=UPI0013BD941D|nr:cation:dicarboxylase symporter family transporter [Xylophilus sp.]KAF1045348.1 MAG: C4-dicarboxylate transport protein [Xylophilus sp.]
MGLLTRLSHSLPALLVCLLAGSVAGLYAPSAGDFAYVAAQVYLSVVSMAAIPLLVVATFFGLRQTIALPFPGRRIAMIAGLALAIVAACAAVGVTAGSVVSPGAHLGSDARGQLGALVMRAGNGGDEAIDLLADGHQVASAPDPRPWRTLLPDNFFRALSEGRSLGILTCALLFGMGFATLSRAQNQTLANLFEAVYRALELIIARANILLPVVAFGIAAHVMTVTEPATLLAMGGFLLQFGALAVLLSAVAIGIVSRRSGLPLPAVLAHLKAPMLVGIVSSSTTASIPHTIEAMSARLGFSRGIVELVVPTASVFLRAGSALYYVLVALFVAGLYDRALDAADIGMVCVGATVAAFASAGNNSLTNVGFAGMVLALLQLPGEAALALFLAVDLICEGPRNLLTLLAACALIAIVSAGLPSERQTAATELPAAPPQPVRFVFSRPQLALLAGGTLVAALLVVLLGVGVGASRSTAPPPAPPSGVLR